MYHYSTYLETYRWIDCPRSKVNRSLFRNMLTGQKSNLKDLEGGGGRGGGGGGEARTVNHLKIANLSSKGSWGDEFPLPLNEPLELNSIFTC